MKKLFLLLTISLLSFSASFSQSGKKLVVMVTRANWCPTCRANEGKIKNELLPAYSGSNDVTILFNDVTNKRTKAKSKVALEAAGVYAIAQGEQATGLVTIINSVNGIVLQRLYVSNSVADIKKAIAEALAGI
jgi:hypothetical protein